MDRVLNFSAGPSTIPLGVLKQAQEELLNYAGRGFSIMEISHRTKIFEEVLHSAMDRVRDLYGFSDDFTILFLQGGASLQFAQVPMNLYAGGVAEYAHKGKPCSTRHLTEEEIKQIFVKALNSLVEVRENVIAELRSLIDSVCQTGELLEEHDRVEQELGVLAERLETLIRENARVAQDQTAYLKQENEIRARYVEKQGHLARLDEQIAERDGKRNILEGMIQVVCDINGEQVAFDEELWSGLLDHIVVKEDGAVVVVFKGGIESGVDGCRGLFYLRKQSG